MGRIIVPQWFIYTFNFGLSLCLLSNIFFVFVFKPTSLTQNQTYVEMSFKSVLFTAFIDKMVTTQQHFGQRK
jgi:hypothetical protein